MSADKTASDGEAPVLEIMVVWITLLLLLLFGPLRPGVDVSNRDTFMSQIDLF